MVAAEVDSGTTKSKVQFTRTGALTTPAVELRMVSRRWNGVGWRVVIWKGAWGPDDG